MISNFDFKYLGLMDSAMQSVPIGNGDLGANIWYQEDALYLLLSKGDAWSELHRLLKTGFLKLSLSPSPFDKNTSLRLSYEDGILYIKAQDMSIKLWVDANAPLYQIEAEGELPRSVSLEIINYRNSSIHLTPFDNSNFLMKSESPAVLLPYDCVEGADCLLARERCIGQYHRNETSCYSFTMQHQGLSGFPEKKDPLLHRMFGFLANSPQLREKKSSLESDEPIKGFRVSIVSYTGQFEREEDWIDQSYRLLQTVKTDEIGHKAYWNAAWKKSWIEVKGGPDARLITESYIAQRYLNLCAGRGKWPVKFNGSLFTCQKSPHETDKENYDYRLWGGMYWFQNTRLIYWSLLYAGDYDLMEPFFRMYMDLLPLEKYKTRLYYGHAGACFPETLTIFGTYDNRSYGIDRNNRPLSYIHSRYMRYHFMGMLELCYMMLLYIKRTENIDFCGETVFPFIQEILLFYRNHYDILDGTLLLHPTGALETWQECADDTPSIAGLIAIVELLIEMPDLPLELEKLCHELYEAMPDIPTCMKEGKEVIAPFRVTIDSQRRNIENPELYAVFPFGRYRIGRDKLSMARDTFALRDIKESCGWQQHGIQAAWLGLAQEAYEELMKNIHNLNPECIFPCFWGPNYDWLPDQDNGNMINLTLIHMLVQEYGNVIRILPAWISEYDVAFRLPVRKDNYVEVEYKDGKLMACCFDFEPGCQVLFHEKVFAYTVN